MQAASMIYDAQRTMPNSPFKRRAFQRRKSARGNGVSGHRIVYECAEFARGGALFEHNQR